MPVLPRKYDVGRGAGSPDATSTRRSAPLAKASFRIRAGVLRGQSARERQHSRAAIRRYRRRPTPRSSRRGPVRWHVRADLHGRHASRSSLQPRLRLSRRLARRREVSIERAAQLSVIVLGEPQITIARDPAFLGHDVLASKDGLIRLKIALRCP